MGNWDGTERRKYPRVQTDDIVAIHHARVGTQFEKSVDLGLGGIRCQVPGDQFSVGDTVEITFRVRDRTATGVGQVIRATHGDPLRQEIAVEFARLNGYTLTSFDEPRLARRAKQRED
jgi:hypothetical protein